jgi:hypothetical protein
MNEAAGSAAVLLRGNQAAVDASILGATARGVNVLLAAELTSPLLPRDMRTPLLPLPPTAAAAAAV